MFGGDRVEGPGQAGGGQDGDRDEDRRQEAPAPLEPPTLGVLGGHDGGGEQGHREAQEAGGGAGPPPAHEQEAEEGERPGRHQAGDRLVRVGGEAEGQEDGGAADPGRQQQARAVGPAAQGQVAQADRHHEGQERRAVRPRSRRSGPGTARARPRRPGRRGTTRIRGPADPLAGVGAATIESIQARSARAARTAGTATRAPAAAARAASPPLEEHDGQRRGQGGGEQQPLGPQQHAGDHGHDGQGGSARGDAPPGDAGRADQGEPGHGRAGGVGPHDVAADQDRAGRGHPEGGAGQPGVELLGQEPGRHRRAEDAEQPGHVEAERLAEHPGGAQQQEGVARVLDVRVVAVTGALVAEDDREGRRPSGSKRRGLVLVRPRALVQGPHLDGVGPLVRGERAGRAHQGQQGEQDDGQGGGVGPQGQPPRPPHERWPPASLSVATTAS